MRKSVLIFALLLSCFKVFPQWGPVNNGLTNLSLGATLLGSSTTHLFSGTLAGAKMYRSSDNGANWTEIQTPVSGNLPYCGYGFNGKYFSGLESSMSCIYYTSDNGNTWNEASGAPATTWVRGFINHQDILFACTSTLGVYRSTDGGSTWSQSSNGLGNLNVIRMESLNSRLFAATIGGGLFVSDDNGVNWLQSNNGIAGGDLNAELVWRMGDNLYYTAQGGGAYVSSNAGDTWNVWPKPSIAGLGILEVARKGSHLYLESRHFALGLRDSIFFSSSEGESWTNITDNLIATDLNASGITEFNGYPFIAYNMISPGNGIYRRDAPTSLPDVLPSSAEIVYPNPFTDKIRISDNFTGLVRNMTLFNSQGKPILSADGAHPISDVSGLASGVYLLRLTLTDNTVIAGKLIKN